MQRNGALFYMNVEGRDTIRERNKQKRKVISCLYDLKDISLKTFENRKTELKSDGKESSCFFILKTSYFLSNEVAPLFRNYTEQKYAHFYLALKANTIRKALNDLYFKHTATR